MNTRKAAIEICPWRLYHTPNHCETAIAPASLRRPEMSARAASARTGAQLRFGLALPVLKAVFVIDRQRIAFGKQPALGLGEVQIEASGKRTGAQKLPDLAHMCIGLVIGRKLLQRDQRRRLCFRDHPLVVARDSLSRHLDHPFGFAYRCGFRWRAALQVARKRLI